MRGVAPAIEPPFAGMVAGMLSGPLPTASPTPAHVPASSLVRAATAEAVRLRTEQRRLRWYQFGEYLRLARELGETIDAIDCVTGFDATENSDEV